MQGIDQVPEEANLFLANDNVQEVVARLAVAVQVGYEHRQHKEQQQQRFLARSKLAVAEWLDFFPDGELSPEEAAAGSLRVVALSAFTESGRDQVIRPDGRGLFRETVVRPAQVAG